MTDRRSDGRTEFTRAEIYAATHNAKYRNEKYALIVYVRTRRLSHTKTRVGIIFGVRSWA